MFEKCFENFLRPDASGKQNLRKEYKYPEITARQVMTMVYALESVVVGDLVYLAYSSPLDFSLPYPLLVLVEDRARVQKFYGVPSVQCLLFKFRKYGGILGNTSPLLVMGFARLILTKGVDYQEHVAEYRVHWNFFFTLAGVALLTSLIHIPPSWCGTLGILLLTVYQTVLSSGLNTYLLSSERGPGLLSLNKDGIASTLGYWGLYLISIQLGHHLTFKHASIVNYFWPSSKHAEKKPEPLLLRWGVCCRRLESRLDSLVSILNLRTPEVLYRRCGRNSGTKLLCAYQLLFFPGPVTY